MPTKKRTMQQYEEPEPPLTLMAKLCQIEADPEAASVFFRGNAAITVRIAVVCGGSVLAKGKSRPLLDFEEDINSIVEIPLTNENYSSLVLQDTKEHSGRQNSAEAAEAEKQKEESKGTADGKNRNNHILIEMLSVAQTTSPGLAPGAGGVQHAGDSTPIPLYDPLDGVLLPFSEPDHAREYRLSLKGQTQATLVLKLWVAASNEFRAHQDALTTLAEAADDVEEQSNIPDTRIHDERLLQEVAEQLGIDPVSEPHLLSIAQQAMETPPPPFWMPVVTEEGSLVYKHMRTGIIEHKNPVLGYFEQLTVKERQRMGNTPQALQASLMVSEHTDNESNLEGGSWESPWVRLQDSEAPDGEYFYSFQEEKKVQRTDLPLKAKIIEPLPAIVTPGQSADLEKTGPRAKDPKVQTLTFYTWWKEGTPQGLKRYTTKIVFDLGTQNYIISFEDAHDTVTLSQVMGRHGPLNQWDLHVTGVIDLLGRNVTLQQCDESTLKWLDYRGKRLAKLRASLKAEVMKFDRKLQHRDYTVPSFRKDGKTDLRSLINQVAELYHRLAAFRKGLAKKLLKGFEEITCLALLATNSS